MSGRDPMGAGGGLVSAGDPMGNGHLMSGGGAMPGGEPMNCGCGDAVGGGGPTGSNAWGFTAPAPGGGVRTGVRHPRVERGRGPGDHEGPDLLVVLVDLPRQPAHHVRLLPRRLRAEAVLRAVIHRARRDAIHHKQASGQA